MTFFSELKRRKVFQVAAVYAVVAWLTIQIIDVVGEPLSLPEWLDTVVIVLLAVGFPIAVIVAWAFDLTPQGVEVTPDAESAAPAPATERRLTYIIQSLVLVAVGFLIFDQYVLDQGPDTTQASIVDDQAAVSSTNLVRRYSINLGHTRPKGGALLHADIALSRDGRRLAYVVQSEQEDDSHLYLRELDQPDAQLLAGTDGALTPYFSPDGEWIAFHRAGGIYTVSVRGSPPKEVSVSNLAGAGGFWSEDDEIFYTHDPADGTSFVTNIVGSQYNLVRVASAGGEPIDVGIGIEIENRETSQVWPHMLPTGQDLMLTSSPFNQARQGRIVMKSLESGEIRTLIEGGYNARYVPTGHIVFMRSSTLWAVPFDLGTLQTTGREVPVIQGIETGGDRGQSTYAFSDDGLLVYLPGFDTQSDSGNMQGRTLTWVGLDGEEETVSGFGPENSFNPQFSPDGRRLALTNSSAGENQDVWIYDLERRTSSRLTFDPLPEQRPLWSPNGQSIVYARIGEDGGLFRQAANGTGGAERLTTNISKSGSSALLGPRPESFSPDGVFLTFREQAENNADWDLYLLTLSGEISVRPLLQEDNSEYRSDISPDGKWIAYTSNETGRNEVYVRPFPNVEDGKWQISSDWGSEPLWAPDGRSLFYLSDGYVVRVSVETESGFSAGPPEDLFPTENFQAGGASAPNYDISPDGERLVMLKIFRTEREKGPTELVVVDNWFEELKRLAPPDPQ